MRNSRDNIVAFSPTTEERVLLHLLAVSLGAERSPLTDEERRDVDWAQVVRESTHQAVCPLVFEAAAAYQADMPKEVYEQWFAASYTYLRNAYKVFRSQKHLVERMDENGYPCIILKGTAAAAYYPEPEKRSFGDVDFLIDPTQREAVEAMLAADGYRQKEMAHICHVVYLKPRESLEMHFEIAGIPFGDAGERVRDYIQGAARRSTMQSIGEMEFPAPQPRDHAIILLLHMQHHMLGEGLGLRHLCDWVTFVTRTADEPFWETEVLPLVRMIGLDTYAAVMTKVGALYLDTACPAWAQGADEALCAAVIADILAGGNFGRKDEMRAASGMLISEHGKAGTQHGMLYNLAHTLHGAVLLQYPIIKKLPILYPFIYGYKAARFCVLWALGKRPSLIKRVPYAIQRKNLYTQLKVFETQDNEVEK